MNILDDITTDPIASTLLGYTSEEIIHNFGEHLEDLARSAKKTPALLLEEMKEWYNGYRFSEEESLVYNPFSVLYLFRKKKFKNYWLTSATPSLLHHLLKTQYTEIIDIDDISLSSDDIGTFEIEDIPLIPILYQTGYLTIKEYDSKDDLYKIGVPNREVRESFDKYLLIALSYAVM